MIRTIHPWALEDLVPIAEAFQAEAGLGSEFDAAHFMAGLHGFSATGRLFAVGSYEGEMLTGALVGILAPQLMCPVMLAQELFWYVLPEHRKSSHALRMVQAFEAWAHDRGAFACVMATFHRSDPGERLPAVFARRGYDAIETHHFKPL